MTEDPADQKDWARKDAKQPEIVPGLEDSIESLGRIIVDAIYNLHAGIGPGLLESVYEAILFRDLKRRGLHVERQKPISFDYDGMTFSDAFRIDLIVNSMIVIEIKSVEHLLPVHNKQLLTYLRLMNLSLGFLMNFGAPTMKLELHRVINSSASSAALRLCVPKTEIDRGGTL